MIVRVSLYSPGDLREHAVVPSIVDMPTFYKNYDERAEQRPASWPERFELSRWTFFAAIDGGTRVGGAAAIIRDRDIALLERRDDLALLWDLRVAPDRRRRGVGRELVNAVERCARAPGRGRGLPRRNADDFHEDAVGPPRLAGSRQRAAYSHAYIG